MKRRNLWNRLVSLLVGEFGPVFTIRQVIYWNKCALKVITVLARRGIASIERGNLGGVGFCSSPGTSSLTPHTLPWTPSTLLTRRDRSPSFDARLLSNLLSSPPTPSPQFGSSSACERGEVSPYPEQTPRRPEQLRVFRFSFFSFPFFLFLLLIFFV